LKLAFSTLGCPGWTIEQAAQAVKRYGYDAIEWRLADGEVITAQTPPNVKARLIEATRRENLTVACLDTSCHIVNATEEGRQAFVQEASAMLDLAVELGAPFIRVFGGIIPEGFTREELLGPCGKALAEAAQYGKSKGVTILLETHDDWARTADTLSLIQAAGTAAPVNILWDVHHPYRMGETPAETLAAMQKESVVSHVHIKDARRDPTLKTGWQLLLLGEGEVPVKEAVGLLQQANYTGYLSLEWEKKWHPEIEEPEVALPQYVMVMRDYINEAAALAD
jgi:sugar phosphate isomerase/epimerase